MRIGGGFGFGAEWRGIGRKVPHQRKSRRVVGLGPEMAVIEPLISGKILGGRHPVRHPAAPIGPEIVERPAIAHCDDRAAVRGRVEPPKPETLGPRQ